MREREGEGDWEREREGLSSKGLRCCCRPFATWTYIFPSRKHETLHSQLLLLYGCSSPTGAVVAREKPESRRRLLQLLQRASLTRKAFGMTMLILSLLPLQPILMPVLVVGWGNGTDRLFCR